MEPLSNSLESSSGLFGPTLADFTELLQFLTGYLKDHPEKVPFKLEDIAHQMHCSLDQIRDLFVPLSKAFDLFRTIQKNPPALPTKLTEDSPSKSKSASIPSPSTPSPSIAPSPPKGSVSSSLPVTCHPAKKHLRASRSQMAQLADFYYLSQTKPLTSKMLPKKFQDLLKIYADLFVQKNDGWLMSDAGQYFAEQYLACKRMNTMPKEIQSEKMTLTLTD